MDQHTDDVKPSPVAAAAQSILWWLDHTARSQDKDTTLHDRYNIDSKAGAGQLLICAIAFMIADAAAPLVEPGAIEAFVDGTIKEIIHIRTLVDPKWGYYLQDDDIAPRLKVAVNALFRDLVWLKAKG